MERDFYDEAFARHRGIFSDEDQRRLRGARVAIAGMGGVGGIHLATLARMGIGAFTIADSDIFEAPNINRQYGASASALGRKKVEVMAEIAKDINPGADIRVIPASLTESNIDGFLDGADIVIDGIDIFAVEAKRLLFNKARERILHVITSGPLGFGAILVTFSPTGMSFDDYFGIRDGMDPMEMFCALVVGIAPARIYAAYMKTTPEMLRNRTGPSVGAACALCANLAATETARILLGREGVEAAPYYSAFDPYCRLYKRGYLYWGGKNPLQWLKRKWLYHKYFSPAGPAA